MKINYTDLIKLFFLFTFSIGTFSLKADKIDSLKNVLNKVSDTEKVDLLIQLSAKYRTKSLDTAKLYAMQALQLALKADDKKKTALSYNELGMIFILKGDNEEAINNINKGIAELGNKDEKLLNKLLLNKGSALVYSGEFDEGLKYFNQVLNYYKKNNDSIKMADVYNNIGVINYYRGEYDKALKNMLNSVKIYEKNGMNSVAVEGYGNIAMIYNENKSYKKAAEYAQKALKIYIQTNDYYSQTGQLVNLANIYKNLNDYDKSIKYLNRALAISEKYDYKKFKALTYSNYSYIYENKGQYKKAIDVLKKALKINKQTGNAEGEAKNLRSLGSLYKKLKKYDLALKYLDESEKLSEKMKLVSDYYDLYKEKSEVYEAMNDYKNSLKYYQKYTIYKDSVFTKEKNKQITEIETKYQTEKKEKEIVQLSVENSKQKLIILKNRYSLYGLSGFVIVILLFGILLLRNRKIKNRQQTLELEQKLFRSQMNPHFIFNSLASIQYFITKNQPLEAGAYLSDFAKLMRLVIENSREEYISLKQEIETMKYYLQMQELRFEYSFTYKFETDPDLETEYVLIPPMLTQPFIENASEHAFSEKNGENKLYVRYLQSDGFLHVEVEDNGIGRQKAQSLKKSDHKSFAISVTKSRLEKLNRKKKKKINFEILDLISDDGNPAGTKIKFSIPLKYSD